MANPEQTSGTEKVGSGIRTAGFVGGLIWLIGEFAKPKFAESFLLPSAGLIVTGEVLRQIGKRRRKNK